MYLRSFLVSCFTAASLLGCRTTSGSPAPAVRPPAPAEAPAVAEPAAPARPPEPIALGLRVEASTRDGQQRLVDSEEILRSGDKLALHVNVGQPAHVYVGLTSSSGSRSVLYPRAGSADEPLAPAVDHRIPKAGWFKLDQDVGHEDLFVYASRSPLTSEQALALIQQDTARARPPPRSAGKKPTARPSPSPPAPAPAPAPRDDGPGALSNDRGLEAVPEDGVEVQGDPNLTKAHFLIKHRR